jgi:uncharacterized protein (TIGR03437 family)
MLWSRAFLYTLFACAPLSAQNWKLVWSDEFEGPANTQPNAAKWGYDIGNNNGWGNDERESYTNSPANAALDGNGNLVIHVLNQPQGITSARIKTQDKFAIAYGKIEARIQIPYGQGIWPAFWMLGANITDAGWPQAGEIDVMENIGKEPATVHATVHGPGYSGANGIGNKYTLASGRFADAFHVFTVEWKPTSLEFFVDGISYHKVTPQTLPAGTQWVYNTPFFILLNVAAGGQWPGPPDTTTTYPQTMTVDYVRVYRSTAEAVVNPGGVVNAASFSPQLAAGSLASVFGTGLADNVYSSLFDSGQKAFPTAVAGVSVLVNGRAAPLTYLAPEQINFQVPWETTVNSADVQVVRSGVASNAQSTKFSPTAPSVFALTATEWFTPSGPATAIVTCTGANCTLWANGFGAPAQMDGAPALFARSLAQCTLTIENLAADVSYCGTAPGLIINQLNFTYPAGLPSRSALNATLTVGDASNTFQVPAPAGN